MNGKTVLFFSALICTGLFLAGCTTTTTIGTPPATPAAAGTAAPAHAATTSAMAVQTTPACPDKEVLTGNWDTRELGYASNHDVREPGVWTDAGPVPVTLTQTCWDATGTFNTGDCDGTLKGKLEKTVPGAFVFSGTFNQGCANTANNARGTFSVTMAADNQSFMGSMYKSGAYGPEANFPPSWLAKKIP